MLRRHLELAADVVLHQLFEKALVRVGQQVVEADAGADEHLLDPRQLPQPAQQMEIFAVIRPQGGAGLWREAFFPLAQPLGQLSLAGGAAEVGRRPAHVVDIAFEARQLDQLFSLPHHRLLTAAGDPPALMIGQGAEVAGPEAAPVVSDGEAHLLDARHPAQRLVAGVIRPLVGQLVHPVEGFRVQHGHGRVLHHDGIAVALDDGLAPHLVLLVLLDAAGYGVLPLARLVGDAHLLVRGAFGAGAGGVLPHRHGYRSAR